ncbi:transketolase (plasmid) [Scytonema sp. HK-05]|uniref:hypothetical protein n=1 Tax=Scytonema sp. HK-05 TaxID=1137095 RepID=UPI0009378588|nr:hypothetical protein [Scytonema sp. HK-05]OKH59425.1 hypothetical protein NIES2130_08870 [Scytonema sp. HK-05]BAY50101.1 transketolase [Scytonema sp. HK-05]
MIVFLFFNAAYVSKRQRRKVNFLFSFCLYLISQFPFSCSLLLSLQEKITVLIPGLDELCIKLICTLLMDAIQQAKSGHSGIPTAMVPVASVFVAEVSRLKPLS